MNNLPLDPKEFKVSFLENIKNYFKINRGNILSEFALIAPVAILLFSGIYEISNYILLNNKVIRAAGVVGDMISRQNITRQVLTAYLNTASDVLKPFDFNTNGSIVASQVQNVGLTTDPAKMTISWQQSVNGASSKVGLPGQFPANLPGNITVIQDQTMIVTEVYYSYKPLIFTNFFPPTILYRASVFAPRTGSMNTLIGE
jgi:Flp pilus assembly protein TadG